MGGGIVLVFPSSGSVATLGKKKNNKIFDLTQWSPFSSGLQKWDLLLRNFCSKWCHSGDNEGNDWWPTIGAMVSHKRRLSGRGGLLSHAAAKLHSCTWSQKFYRKWKGATSLVAGSESGLLGGVPGTRMKIASFFTTPQPLSRRVNEFLQEQTFPTVQPIPKFHTKKKKLLALVSSLQCCRLSQLTLKRPKALQPCPSPRPPSPKSPPRGQLGATLDERGTTCFFQNDPFVLGLNYSLMTSSQQNVAGH